MTRARSLPARYFALIQRLFGGRLPKYRFRRPPGGSLLALDGSPALAGTNHEYRIIFFSPGIPQSSIDRYLLHEMCHVEIRTASRLHGRDWCACMRRVGAGAPWLDAEVLDYETQPPYAFPEILEHNVRSEMDRILQKVGCQRWPLVRRHLALTGDSDENHFDQLYPWAFAEWVDRSVLRSCPRVWPGPSQARPTASPEVAHLRVPWSSSSPKGLRRKRHRARHNRPSRLTMCIP